MSWIIRGGVKFSASRHLTGWVRYRSHGALPKIQYATCVDKQAEIEKNKNSLLEIYLDKLEGKITEEFWLSMQNQITKKIEKYKGLINAYDRAELKTMNEVTSTLELSETAYNKYLEGNDEIKRKIVNSLLSNLTLRDGKLSYTYKKPFD